MADLPKSNDVNFSNIAYQADASASTTLIDMVDGSGNKRDLTTSTGSASINIKWLAH
ncbi:MAG: PhoP regulatory network YrbL family protein [Renibacterium salmoninarum]|nr:PhoP regulatory network YrbL family protein [Renibacterium salmoninarum]